MPLVKKIYYLKGYLRSEVARIISRILLLTEGCETAWQIFTHYNNPQRRLELSAISLIEAKPQLKCQ